MAPYEMGDKYHHRLGYLPWIYKVEQICIANLKKGGYFLQKEVVSMVYEFLLLYEIKFFALKVAFYEMGNEYVQDDI